MAAEKSCRAISIRWLLLGLIAVTLAPSLAVEALVYRDWARSTYSDQEESNLQMARLLSRSLHELVRDLSNETEGLAAAMTRGNLSPQQAADMLAGPRLKRASVRVTLWTDANGRVVNADQAQYIGLDLGGLEYFHRVAAAQKPLLSDLFQWPDDGSPTVAIAKSARDDTGLRGVAIIVLDADRLWNNLMAQRHLSGPTIAVVDHAGRLVFRWPAVATRWDARPLADHDPLLAQALGGQESAGQGPSPFDTQTVLEADVPVPDVGWAVLAAQNQAEVDAPANRALATLLTVNVVVVLASLAAAIVLGRLIGSSVSHVAQYARDMAPEGREPDGSIRRVRELSELRDSVAEMAHRRRAAEASLREIEELARLSTEAADVGVWSWSLQSNQVNCDGQFCRLHGLPLGQQPSIDNLLQVTQPDYRDRISDAVARAMAGEANLDMEIPIMLPDGRSRWLAIRGRSLDGIQPRRMLGIVMDITDRKEAEGRLRDSEENYRQLVQLVATAIVRLDTQGRVTFINDYAQRLFGFSADEVLGKSVVGTLVPPRDSAGRDMEKMIQEVVTNPERHRTNENENIRKDGTRLWMAWINRPIYDPRGRVREVLAVGVDISDRHATEQTLRDVATELSRSNAELQQFAYVASHDLQEPLRMIAGHLELLARRYEGQVDERANASLRFAVDGAKRMQTLIEDLLAYSRVGTRGRPSEPVDLNDVMRQTTQNLQATLDAAQAQIEIEPLPVVMGDRSQLSQLFQNLIANAVKFCAQGVRPAIHVRAERMGDWCVVSVRDNGIGIAREHQDRVFQVFQRLHTRAQYAGTGIGLAICKKIVERHGGRIWVESEPDMGSTFFFTLQPAERLESA